MINRMFIGCDSDENDYLQLDTEEDMLYVQISDRGKVSGISIKSLAKIEMLIDCLNAAKKDLSR